MKLFVDVDGTLTNSIEAFCYTYNHIYQYHNNFKPANWIKVNKWDFSDQCPLLKNAEDVENIFSSKIFFKRLQFMPNAKEVLYELNKKYEIIIVSIGTPLNVARKSIWLYQHLGFVKDVILITNKGTKMDKSCIDMKDGILIDDHIHNLISSNAKTKICFGKEYEWNKDFQGIRAKNWLEVKEMLL